MKIVSTNVYVGPNVFDMSPLIRLTVDLGERASTPLSAYGDRLFDPLLQHLPGLANETSADGSEFIDRMRNADDCGLGELLAHAALVLQKQAAAPGELARVHPGSEPNEVDVLYGYVSREIGLEAGDVARLIILELIDPADSAPINIAEEIDEFMYYASRRTLGPSALALVKAADERNIPWLRLNDASLIQLGQGKYQKRIEAALTSETAHTAVEIAGDKEFCIKLLYDLGLPVPEQRFVRNGDQAVRAANRIGYPVVVKPADGNHGRGVTVNLQTDNAVFNAYDLAYDEGGGGVVVETMIPGDDYRLLVVDGELVAAAKRMPAHVVGDGKSSVSDLVDIENQNPRRGVGHENMLTRLELDKVADALLDEQGIDRASIPDAGQVVRLKKTANLSTGGTAVDVTDSIHPDIKLMAERAIKAVGLDIGGVDFLTTDITQSYRDTGGAICEINAGPGIRMHISPSEGQGRDVGGKIMDMLFPPGSPSRIPVAALTGTNGKTTTARMLSHILKMAGRVVGQTSTDAVLIDGNITVRGDMTGPVAANMVLRDPQVDTAVLETARGGIVRAGLGYRYCDVGAVLNVSSDHLGQGGVDTIDDLAEVKSLVVKAAQDTAVLNADNEYTLKMAAVTTAKNICYVTMNPANALVRAHIKLGKRAVVLEHGANGEQIVIYDNDAQIPLIWTHLIPATIEGKATHNVENAMFAAGMAYSLGLTLDQIRSGLRTFNTSFYQSPGRMNVFDEHGFRVILDYGHNEAAVGAMVDLVERLEPRGKKIVCVTCPGDRRDEDARAIAQKVAGKFDVYLCHSDDDPRGRAPDEIPKIIRDELIAAGVADDAIRIIPDELTSIDTALEMARLNDLVLVFCEGIVRCWKQIIYFDPVEKPSTESKETPVADASFDVPEGFRVINDERGVRIVADE
ncbi:MAG: cyanophycin synthetase [Pseudomonadota bacterium]